MKLPGPRFEPKLKNLKSPPRKNFSYNSGNKTFLPLKTLRLLKTF